MSTLNPKFRFGDEQEIRPWTHMMDVPQLHGLGPAANRLLESYSQLLKVIHTFSLERTQGAFYTRARGPVTFEI